MWDNPVAGFFKAVFVITMILVFVVGTPAAARASVTLWRTGGTALGVVLGSVGQGVAGFGEGQAATK